jgi:hypothetical protein
MEIDAFGGASTVHVLLSKGLVNLRIAERELFFWCFSRFRSLLKRSGVTPPPDEKKRHARCASGKRA